MHATQGVFHGIGQLVIHKRSSTAAHRRTLARSPTLPIFQVAEDFALPAVTGSFSLRFTVGSQAFSVANLALRRGLPATGGYVSGVWLPSALDSIDVSGYRVIS